VLDPNTYRILNDLGYGMWFSGTTVAGVIVLSTALLSLKAGILPKWLTWLSFVVAGTMHLPKQEVLLGDATECLELGPGHLGGVHLVVLVVDLDVGPNLGAHGFLLFRSRREFELARFDQSAGRALKKNASKESVLAPAGCAARVSTPVENLTVSTGRNLYTYEVSVGVVTSFPRPFSR